MLPQILERLPVTILLTGGAVILWLAIGIPIGIISAIKTGSWIDRLAMGLALIAISAPVYFLGLVALFLFDKNIGRFPLLPGSGAYGDATTVLGHVAAMIMPWCVLAAAFAAIYARFLRGNLIDTMQEDYIRTARAKGLSERRVVFRHGVRSAITPIVTLLGLDIGILLGGAILTETVFNIPGHRTLRVRRDRAVRSPRDPGHRAVRGVLHRHHEPGRGHPLRLHRSESALLMAPLLEVEDLRVHFETEDGLVKAVDGISYRVDRGETLGIVGESGSGKSVSSLTVMGLTRARNARISGTVRFDGEDLLGASDDDLRGVRGDDIAMIFQDPLSSLHPFYKVGNQIVEAILSHRDVSKAQAFDRAVEMLNLVGIPEPRRRADSYPHEFSGGMRQRAMIAMALANDPKLLIADEPTTALDVTVQAQILELIERLQSEFDTAVVVITHDLGVVAEMADEIAVMYAGRIVEQGKADTIFNAPEHPYTWGLLSSIPRMDVPRGDELVPIPGRPPSLIHLPGGCSFHPRCPYVRDAHRRVEPVLDPVNGSPDHKVACLLDSGARRRLWEELQTGVKPAEARKDVIEEGAA